MKKGIVMEKHRNFIIVMTADGLFLKAAPITSADVGEEVTFEPLKQGALFSSPFTNKVHIPIRLVAMICIILLFWVPFSFVADGKKTYAYVNIDINPSIELEIDKKLHVYSILPLNDDAVFIVNELADFKGEKVAKVIEMIMVESEAAGLIKNGKNMLVGVNYVNELDVSVLDVIQQYFSNIQADWEIATLQIPGEIRDAAAENNLSMNEAMVQEIEKVETASKEEKLAIDEKEKAIIHSIYHTDEKILEPEPEPEPEQALSIKEKTATNNKQAVKKNAQPQPQDEPKGKQNKEANKDKKHSKDHQAHRSKTTEKKNAEKKEKHSGKVYKDKKHKGNKKHHKYHKNKKRDNKYNHKGHKRNKKYEKRNH